MKLLHEDLFMKLKRASYVYESAYCLKKVYLANTTFLFLFSLAMPPFPPFAVPFAPMGAQSGLFRGAGPGRNGPNQGPGGPSGGNNRSVPRGFESGGWPWGGWGGDGNWAHHQPRGHMSAPW